MKKILRYNQETKQVEEFDADKVPCSGNQMFVGNNAWATGLRSIGAGCHASQVEEFRKDVEDAGISGVEILNDGSVKFSCRSARKKYMQLRGLYDRDAGYGDAAPTDF